MIRTKLRWLFVVLGVLSTSIGVVGIVTPVLPTTVFFLIAAGLFARSSPRLEAWLRGNRITGPFLKAYTSGEPMNRRHQIVTIALLWATLAVSAWFMRRLWWVLLILALVGIGVTWHLIDLGRRKGRG